MTAEASQINLLNEPVVAPEPLVPGLAYIPNYIDQYHAEYLIGRIDSQAWLNDLKRRVQHYGYRYDYKARSVTKETKIDAALPDWLLPTCNQLRCDTFFARVPDQVIVNEYLPGQGIAPHIDCVRCFEETIASLSLGSTCIMNFTHSKTHKKASVFLEPGSLLVMSGEARYIWQHAIVHRKTDRYNGSIFPRGRRISLTFRNVIISQ